MEADQEKSSQNIFKVRCQKDKPKIVIVAPAEKVTQGVAKGTFSRAKKALMILFQRRAKDSELLEARNTLIKCYSMLKEAHNK